jgi:hypothetical protein
MFSRYLLLIYKVPPSSLTNDPTSSIYVQLEEPPNFVVTDPVVDRLNL